MRLLQRRLALLVMALAITASPRPLRAQDSSTQPAVPPAEQPSPVQDALEKAAERVRLTRQAFSGYAITVGWSIKQAGLREDKGTTSDDAPVFLPEGGTGKDPFSGDKVGQTQGPWLNFAGPVKFFKEGGTIGWGYNAGYFQTKFDKYESGLGYDVSDVNGSLTGTFLYAIPTLVIASAPGGKPDVFRGGGQFGAGLVASRLEGKMNVRRETVFPHNFANNTYKGNGEWRYSPALSAELAFILFNHLSLGFSEILLQSGGVYYAEFGLRIGAVFGL